MQSLRLDDLSKVQEENNGSCAERSCRAVGELVEAC